MDEFSFEKPEGAIHDDTALVDANEDPYKEHLVGKFSPLKKNEQIDFIHMCCNLAQSVGSIDCEIQPQKGMHFFCFGNLSIVITLEPLVRSGVFSKMYLS